MIVSEWQQVHRAKAGEADANALRHNMLYKWPTHAYG
jgi:hypothetical protein